MNRASMDRFIDTINGSRLDLSALSPPTFSSGSVRNMFNYRSRIRSTSGAWAAGHFDLLGHRRHSIRGHITVDLVWANVRPEIPAHDRRVCDAGAAVRVTVQTWTLFDRCAALQRHVLTSGLHMPTWPVFRGGVGRRRSGAAGSDPYLPADFNPDLMHDPRSRRPSRPA